MSASRKLYDDMAYNLSIDLGDTDLWDDPISAAGAIAQVIRTSIVPAFCRDNPRFDRMRFYRACGLTEQGDPK